MHDKINKLFESIWSKVPLDAPSWLEYSLLSVEAGLHDLVTLFTGKDE